MHIDHDHVAGGHEHPHTHEHIHEHPYDHEHLHDHDHEHHDHTHTPMEELLLPRPRHLLAVEPERRPQRRPDPEGLRSLQCWGAGI